MIKLSVVICTFNRSDFLVDALDSLANQSLSKESYEVIVVNNNSTDATEKVSTSFRTKNTDINFQYVIEHKQGLSHARNKGINTAKGEYISFVDDDARPDFAYAESIVKSFENYSDYDALGGKVIPFYDDVHELKWLSKYVWGMVAKVDNGEQIRPFTRKYPAGCNMAFRKSIFGTIGLFDIELANRCDDRYIFTQIKKAGLNVLYTPKASVKHYIPNSRISEEGIIKLARLNGSEHRKLLRHSNWEQFIKFIDLIIKLGLSIILSVGFILKGEKEKAKIFKIIYFTTVGYLSKK